MMTDKMALSDKGVPYASCIKDKFKKHHSAKKVDKALEPLLEAGLMEKDRIRTTVKVSSADPVHTYIRMPEKGLFAHTAPWDRDRTMPKLLTTTCRLLASVKFE